MSSKYREYARVRNWAKYRCVKTTHNLQIGNIELFGIMLSNSVDFRFTVTKTHLYSEDPQDLMILKLKSVDYGKESQT